MFAASSLYPWVRVVVGVCSALCLSPFLLAQKVLNQLHSSKTYSSSIHHVPGTLVDPGIHQ